ncbi:MAG: betaine/proline/choline family ABC transporter ATP-binding protein [Synechococcales cyanobacterium]
MSASIEFKDVSLVFPRAARPAVAKCSFRIEPGELIVLLGPSGCGKTTLLKMINRLYEPTQGSIFIDGVDSRQWPVTQLRQKIGYVIQQAGLFPHMTVAQNIAVVPKLLHWERPRIQQRVDELLRLIQLPPQEYHHRYPAQLSGGQQQRVGLARALAADPGLLLMDEPFGAIDAITRASLQEEMLRLQQQLHKTIVFVSHDVEEALLLADRLLIMQAGQIVQFATPFQVLSQPANAFVRELVGTDDMVRQLGLLRVKAAMMAVEPEDRLPDTMLTIAAEETLRRALSVLLRSGAPHLTVLENGKAVGTLTLERIRDLTSMGALA